jgi:FkbH-like protein
MKLNEALKAVAATRGFAVGHRAFLACGFEPLHLPTFLQAHHATRFEGQALAVSVGVYGDLLGNLERARGSEATLSWAVLEWSDVDPRLGLRSTGAWSGARQAELLADAAERLNRLHDAIARVAERMPVVVAAPSVPFPLLGHTSGWQSSPLELELELLLARFGAAVAKIEGVRWLHPGRLAALSPPGNRSDPRMELAAGFPYALEHTSALALGLLELGYPSSPKKGLITDLDDTLWAGIVGEVGAESVSWSQAEHGQIHGVYQLLLRQLADAGVLLGIASKNDKEVVRSALGRSDLLVDEGSFYPVAVSWGPKSEAVAAISRTWNVGADALVIVDDSAMELEEVGRAHPGITCLQFTPKDPRRVLALLAQLRDLFGKPLTLEEDRLRAASIRSSALFEEQKTSGDLQSFLTGLDGVVSFDARRDNDGGRLLELINKTNQFSLNGERLTEGEWLRFLRDGHVALGIGYSDRLGSLGTIGVAVGRELDQPGAARVLELTHWVLSCRAFSRRIEDHALRYLFQLSGCQAVRLMFRRTARNQPFVEFLARLGVIVSDGSLELRRADLEGVLADLPHREVLK